MDNNSVSLIALHWSPLLLLTFYQYVDFQSLDFNGNVSGNADVLQDFDFDSFLHNDADGNDNFNFDTSGFLDASEIGAE